LQLPLYFDFINDLLEFVPKFLPEGSISVDKQAGTFYAAAILALFSKSYKTIRAIKTLCLEGLSSDANALLRTMIECLISLRYLSEGNKENKGIDYFEFCLLQNQKILNALKKDPIFKDIVTNEAELNVKDVTLNIKSKMSEDDFKKKYKASHWSGVNIEVVANRVGLQAVYDLPFRISSRAIHATDFSDHMKYQNGFVINILPGDKWCKEVLITSIRIFLMILVEVKNSFDLNQDEEVASFEQRFRQVVR
jgi:hypothetical protein